MGRNRRERERRGGGGYVVWTETAKGEERMCKEKLVKELNEFIFMRVRKIEKATISFFMSLSVRPPVCPHGTTRLLLDGF